MKHVFPKAIAALIGLVLMLAALAYVSHEQGWHSTERYSSVVASLISGVLGCGIMLFAVIMFIRQLRVAIAIRKMRNRQRAERNESDPPSKAGGL